MAKFLKARSEGAFISEVCKKCSFTELKSAYEGSKKLFDDKDKNPLDYAFRKGKLKAVQCLITESLQGVFGFVRIR